MKKIATEKSGSVRNQAIYFQLYESFISEMKVLTCSCIKQDKSNKKICFIFCNIFFYCTISGYGHYKKTGSVRNLKMHISFSSEIVQPFWL